MQRKAVVLHDYAGYRAAEVARITGSTEAAYACTSAADESSALLPVASSSTADGLT